MRPQRASLAAADDGTAAPTGAGVSASGFQFVSEEQKGVGVCAVCWMGTPRESLEAHLLQAGKRLDPSASWRTGFQRRRQNGPEPSRTD